MKDLQGAEGEMCKVQESDGGEGDDIGGWGEGEGGGRAVQVL